MPSHNYQHSIMKDIDLLIDPKRVAVKEADSIRHIVRKWMNSPRPEAVAPNTTGGPPPFCHTEKK